jgi:hypothetical protein
MPEIHPGFSALINMYTPPLAKKGEFINDRGWVITGWIPLVLVEPLGFKFWFFFIFGLICPIRRISPKLG